MFNNYSTEGYTKNILGSCVLPKMSVPKPYSVESIKTVDCNIILIVKIFNIFLALYSIWLNNYNRGMYL